MLPEVSVVYLRRGGAQGEVLLGEKLTGLGAGRLVGPGGKLEPGETPVDAAVREVREEIGVEVAPADLRPVGALDYHFPDRPAWSQRSHVFVADRWRGRPVESVELRPAWFALDAVPYDRMWDDARRWLPAVLRGATVDASCVFAADLATVSRWEPRPA
ncbi:8-oxo-dGTP diphosphatase [Microbacterium sp. HMH0099]|uniref:8-oxo-dGTP diphosphatase n=1 Tax=Microbacterium sp. HMH0099 TaxID=3414026 RepID=UPI003BF6E3AC